MAAKPIFTEAQAQLLRETAIKVWETKFQKLKKTATHPGGQEAMALALGITQQSVSNLLRGTYRPAHKVARAIANLDGQTLEQLVGQVGADDEPDGNMIMPGVTLHPFANLKTCVDFYAASKHWSAWTIAAARAGFFGTTDFAPPEWATKLDSLEKVLEKAKRA